MEIRSNASAQLGLAFVDWPPLIAQMSVPAIEWTALETRMNMAQKLSSNAMKKLDTLTEARRKWDRIRSLVEMAASQKTGQDMYLSQIRRAAEDVGRVFMNGGYGPLAASANDMVLLVRRGGTLQTKIRAMRELVGTLHAAIDRAEKAVMDAEKSGTEH